MSFTWSGFSFKWVHSSPSVLTINVRDQPASQPTNTNIENVVLCCLWLIGIRWKKNILHSISLKSVDHPSNIIRKWTPSYLLVTGEEASEVIKSSENGFNFDFCFSLKCCIWFADRKLLEQKFQYNHKLIATGSLFWQLLLNKGIVAANH